MLRKGTYSKCYVNQGDPSYYLFQYSLCLLFLRIVTYIYTNNTHRETHIHPCKTEPLFVEAKLKDASKAKYDGMMV